jgi:hypothetical protein
MTGFNDSVSYPDLVVQPEAAGLGAGCTGRRSQPRNIAAAIFGSPASEAQYQDSCLFYLDDIP